MALLAYTSLVQATLITTSGDAITGDVSISFSESFDITGNGDLSAIAFGVPPLDSQRDVWSFANWLTIKVNDVAYTPSYHDFSDGIEGSWPFGPYLYLGGISLTIGDSVSISGTASNGFVPGGWGGSSSTYTVLPTGEYALTLITSDGSIIGRTATDVPEPSTLAIFALGMIGLASRRFKKQS